MTMDLKEVLMKSAVNDNFSDFSTNFHRLKRVNDEIWKENFFDYELLKAALSRRNQLIAYFLIKQGCKMRRPDKMNLEETPLHLAMHSLFEFSYLLLMLREGASIYDKNPSGETPLHAAFKANEHRAVDVVLDYISNCHLRFNPESEDDVLHFHIACVRNHLNSVKQYLKFGFDVNRYLSLESSELSGLNPLHYAISNGYSDLFKILLNYGGDISIKNSEGLTPLHIFYYNYYKYDRGIFGYDTFKLFRCRDEMIEIFKCANDPKLVNSVDLNGVSFLHIYCLINHPYLVRVLIDKGADINSAVSVNCSYSAGYTPLHFAVKHAHVEIIELLLKNGADYTRLDGKGVTPIHLIPENHTSNEIANIMKILDYKICSVATDKDGNTVIHALLSEMFRCLNSEIINTFMSVSRIPLTVNTTNHEGISLFHIACTRNDINQVNDFLYSGAKIDDYVKSGLFTGYTALHFAVLFNQKEVVEVLLKRNARVDVETITSKVTPLHLACKYSWTKYCELVKPTENIINLDGISNCFSNQLDIIKLLLLHGADVNAKDFSGFTPLHHACIIIKNKYAVPDWPDSFKDTLIKEINTRMLEIMKILISNRGNVNACTNENLSIFHLIVKNDFLDNSNDLLKFLTTSGGNINAVDNAGLTPLHLAVKYEKIEFTKSLLRNKANINIKCKNSKTPLQTSFIKLNTYPHTNVVYYETDVCHVFLNNCSNINDKDKRGRTLLHAAFRDQKWLLIERLLYYGADINAEDSRSRSTVDNLYKYVHDPKLIDLKVIVIFTVHVKKLLCLGLYVSNKVMGLYNNLCKYLSTALSETSHIRTIVFGNKCNDELNRMKLEMIDDYTSLYDILKQDAHQLSKLVKHDNLITLLRLEKTDKQFPLYAHLLRMQFKKGVIRYNMLKSATTPSLLSSIIFGKKMLHSCYDSILTDLTNKEVINLRTAADVGDSSDTDKKFRENDLNEMEQLLNLTYPAVIGSDIGNKRYSQISVKLII